MQITYRLFQWEDVSLIADLFNSTSDADKDGTRFTPEMIENAWKDGSSDPTKGVFLAFDEATLVGYCGAHILHENNPALGYGNGVIHLDYRNKGIGRALIEMSEKQFIANSTLPEDIELKSQRSAAEHNPAQIRLFESFGYEVIRKFYQMSIAISPTSTIPVPQFPEGIELRPFLPERDSHAIYEAEIDSFHDHVNLLGADETYEEWHKNMLQYPLFDASLWFVAWSGDQVVGALFSEVEEFFGQKGAYIPVVFVRRAWRKKGLASALLYTAFHEFQQRNLVCANLMVDTDSLTNAVAMYERVGMRADKIYRRYQRVLRAGIPYEAKS